jgi:hypothetical protein
VGFDGSASILYRSRAKELREIAATCHLPEVREQLRDMADQFDSLARQVEERALHRSGERRAAHAAHKAGHSERA